MGLKDFTILYELGLVGLEDFKILTESNPKIIKSY